MGKRFDVEYDDFTGGYFVGGTETKQPRNTWKGTGIICTADEGFLMPDGGWTNRKALIAGGTGTTIWPVVTSSDAMLGANGSTAYFAAGNGTSLNTIALAGPPTAAYQSFCNGSGIYIANNGTANITYSTGYAVTAYATPVSFNNVLSWGSFGIGFASGSSTFYYSAAGAFTSWPAGNYYTIDIAQGALVSGVVHNGDLYLQTKSGWWVATGIPGSTLTLRQVATIGATYAPSGNYNRAVISTLAGVMHLGAGAVGGGGGDVARLLRGSQVSNVASAPGMFDTLVSCVSVGAHSVVVGVGADGWGTLVWSSITKRWRRPTLPLSATYMGKTSMTSFLVASDDYETNLKIRAAVTYDNGATYDVYMHDHWKEPMQPVSTSNTFDSATVDLADYMSNQPFRVNEILAEVDFGTPTTQTGVRSMTVQALTDAVVDMPATFPLDVSSNVAPKASSEQTVKWTNATATKIGHRQMVRFGVNDGNITYAAVPRITLQGVKLRRVVMRCEEV